MNEFRPEACTPPLKRSELGGWDVELNPADLAKPLDFAAIFGREGRNEVEIGSGSGSFLSTEAARRPAVNFLALERDGKQVRRAKDKWRRRQLLNTRIVRTDAHYFLEEFAPPAAVDAYIILYSDPWFKKRHFKRRLFQPRLLPILERTLRPGGGLFIKTDITDYYEVITDLLDGVPFLRKIEDRRADLEPDPDDVMTNYQRKALEKGHPLHQLRYERV